MKKFLSYFVAIVLISVLAISVVSAAEESKPDISLTCFAQTRFDATIDDDGLKNDQFKVSRVRIRATGKMREKLGFFVQLDPGSATTLKDARLRVNIHKYLTLQAGRFLLPFGIQSPVNPYNLTTVDYCQVIGTLNKGLWDVGASAYGKYPLNDKISLSYVGAAVNGNTGGFIDNNKSKDYLGRVGVSLPSGISVGGSAYIGEQHIVKEVPTELEVVKQVELKTEDGAQKVIEELVGVEPKRSKIESDVTKNRFGADLKIDHNPFLLKGEFLIGKDGKFATKEDDEEVKDVNSMGFYAIAAYKVRPSLQIAAKFDFLDVNTDKDDDESTIISVGVNYFFTGKNIVQLFCKRMNKPGDVTEHGVIGQLAMIFNL